MKLSEGTPQQQADMKAYRAHAKRIYTEEYPCCLSFAAEIELLEAMIRQHWTRDQARVFMTYLVNASWDYFDPYGFIKQWTLKAVEAIPKGMTFEELQATGLFEEEGNLFPMNNLTEAQKMRHELMAFDEERQANPKVSFKEQIKAMQKNAKLPHRSSN